MDKRSRRKISASAAAAGSSGTKSQRVDQQAGSVAPKAAVESLADVTMTDIRDDDSDWETDASLASEDTQASAELRTASIVAKSVAARVNRAPETAARPLNLAEKRKYAATVEDAPEEGSANIAPDAEILLDELPGFQPIDVDGTKAESAVRSEVGARPAGEPILIDVSSDGYDEEVDYDGHDNYERRADNRSADNRHDHDEFPDAYEYEEETHFYCNDAMRLFDTLGASYYDGHHDEFRGYHLPPRKFHDDGFMRPERWVETRGKPWKAVDVFMADLAGLGQIYGHCPTQAPDLVINTLVLWAEWIYGARESPHFLSDARKREELYRRVEDASAFLFARGAGCFDLQRMTGTTPTMLMNAIKAGHNDGTGRKLDPPNALSIATAFWPREMARAISIVKHHDVDEIRLRELTTTKSAPAPRPTALGKRRCADALKVIKQLLEVRSWRFEELIDPASAIWVHFPRNLPAWQDMSCRYRSWCKLISGPSWARLYGGPKPTPTVTSGPIPLDQLSDEDFTLAEADLLAIVRTVPPDVVLAAQYNPLAAAMLNDAIYQAVASR